ncbi:TPA: winged helix-turn-helix transcriptional regulator [Acinetobacter baumannii]|uniref:winged helix-turn-helix transcriptional regulator n=1 Tax=Acinetobacter TaxID=469 RepID=UPI00057EC638|nr:helix-turn-helix domain-containing protein [Acinetobacter nosocomialis]MDO7467944.1 helix-turn-helix domain-containing protein [Acinetobacter baumannii]AJB48193.1 transcriptional regulator [Acinetobacter nosocomialis]MBR7741527.1 helix-turn-helix transcriptional regulator [Acinetobacter nosocomialis]MBR7751939.1 helix-turn-helix transcriptional regulator [Acinetobacter nosocomialis]MDO7214320.1 helix-turn-helix domain-containing protein [Acinetobacter nosocomialis]
MKGYVFAADCPSRKILLTLTSRWSILILVALRDQRLRFNELKKIIDGISEKMLAQTLKTLENEGFIIRQDYAEIPPRVDYQLTDFGREASERLFDLTTWLENNISNLLENQPSPETVQN